MIDRNKVLIISFATFNESIKRVERILGENGVKTITCGTVDDFMVSYPEYYISESVIFVMDEKNNVDKDGNISCEDYCELETLFKLGRFISNRRYVYFIREGSLYSISDISSSVTWNGEQDIDCINIEMDHKVQFQSIINNHQRTFKPKEIDETVDKFEKIEVML